MATLEFWIQIENHPWDVCPTNITDRMTGQSVQDVAKASGYQITGATNNPSMNFPLSDDALILRRYTENWAAPDDRKVNPWDLNEPDPAATNGTIPGPVIECNVGDKVIVHFRNKDQRTSLETELVCFPTPIGEICFPIKVPKPLPVPQRTHSLHPHGFAFAPTSDGAYPLSPPDSTQAIDAAERAAWDSVNVTGQLKKGDRVPPDATFDYTWIAGAPSEDDPNTIEPWPTTSGVWLYHDHSICDTKNVQLGAIGIIVIHNPNDPQDVIVEQADLPDGSPNGSPIGFRCFPFPFDVGVLPGQLEFLGRPAPAPHGHGMPGMAEGGHAMANPRATPKPAGKGARRTESHHKKETDATDDVGGGGPVLAMPMDSLNLEFELDKDLKLVKGICLPFYRTPPDKAQYLLLFHNLGDAGMCINGRKYLGNTPSVVARAPKVSPPAADGTLMRFGVIGMGNTDGFHTFHLHGHRWVIPGPDGNSPGGGGADPGDGGNPPFGIQFSPQVRAVSQFEDTRTFGPANSFVFTIQQGEFTGAIENAAVGEWHMHCHVLTHMMDGMMGSLVVRNGGELALRDLPSGDPTLPCPMPGMGGGMGGGTSTVQAINDAGNPTGFSWSPANLTVNKNDSVVFKNISAGPHSVEWDTPGAPPSVPVFNAGASSSPVSMSNTGTFNYHCGIHGPQMKGTINVT